MERNENLLEEAERIYDELLDTEDMVAQYECYMVEADFDGDLHGAPVWVEGSDNLRVNLFEDEESVVVDAIHKALVDYRETAPIEYIKEWSKNF